MNQMQSFIEKAKNDKDLMAKLDTLGASGAEADKIVALAAEHGFSITAEDYQQAVEMAGTQKAGELAEEDLEAVAGGTPTEDRHDPAVCSQYNDTHYWCVGFLKIVKCVWYYEVTKNNYGGWQRMCGKGHFNHQSP